MKWLIAAALALSIPSIAYGADDDEETSEDSSGDSSSEVGGSVGGVPGRGGASGPLPNWRFNYTSLLVARSNPLGLNVEFRPALRKRLYESTSAVGRDNYMDIAPTITATPAFVRGGLSMRLQPAAVLRLGARVEGIQYFGGFDQLQSWEDAADAEAQSWDDDQQDVNGEAGENYVTSGWFAAGEVLLRAKVSNVAILNQTRLLYANIGLQDEDTVFYEITYDTLLANQNFLAVNDFSTVWVPETMPLTAGVRWSLVQAQHPDEPDSVAAEALHRVGPLIAWKFKGDEGKAVSNLSAFTIVQWWLKHPYRTGQVSNQAVPYLLIGVSMSGELLPFN